MTKVLKDWFINPENKPVIVSAEVLTVDEEHCLCDVLPTGSSSKLLDVRLTALSSPEQTYVCCYPKIGAEVIVAYLEGTREEAVVVVHGQIDRIEIHCPGEGKIKFSGDSFGGLTKTPELKTQLKKNNDLLEAMLDVIKGGPITEPGNGSISSFQTALKSAVSGKPIADFSDIENKNVQHG